MTNEIQTLGHWELMGSRFTIFGTIDAPLFLAKEVAERIEHTQTSHMVESVDDDEKLIGTIFLSGQNRDVWFLTEYGLYEVLMQSRKPVAKRFKAKVKEVLRELRRTGKYDGTKESVLPGGCTLDGEPVATIQMIADHFGIEVKYIYNGLYAKQDNLIKNIDYIPACRAVYRKFKEQNPGVLPISVNWVTLIRPSGFHKLEARFRRPQACMKKPRKSPALLEPPRPRTTGSDDIVARAREQLAALHTPERPSPWATDCDALAANVRSKVAALSSLLRSYQRRNATMDSRHGIAVAIEEAAESILVTARGMKSVAKEG